MIKFRLYDKLTQRLIYPESPKARYYTLDLNGKVYNYQDGSGGDDYEIHRWTGLQDIDGVDIYEYDIVKTQKLSLNEILGANDVPQYDKGEVRWLRESWCLCAPNIGSCGISEYVDCYCHNTTLKIVARPHG